MGGEELRLIEEAFESNYIAPLGPMVDAFEREFAEKVGIAHAVAVSSGTAAMHLALDLLGVGPGDEVLAQPNWGRYGSAFRGGVEKGRDPAALGRQGR